MSDEVRFWSASDLAARLHRLGPVTGGDVLVFDGIDNEALRTEIIEAVLHYYVEIARGKLAETGVVGNDRAAAHVPLVVFLEEGQSIEHLDEAEMLRLGWKRVAP